MERYYDYVLGLIPVVMVGVTITLFFAGVQLSFAVPVGAAGSILLILHALFVNAPIHTESQMETQQLVQSRNID